MSNEDFKRELEEQMNNAVLYPSPRAKMWSAFGAGLIVAALVAFVVVSIIAVTWEIIRG